MIKLNASYSKKVPAQQKYSSESYLACIEVELPTGTGIPGCFCNGRKIGKRKLIIPKVGNEGRLRGIVAQERCYNRRLIFISMRSQSNAGGKCPPWLSNGRASRRGCCGQAHKYALSRQRSSWRQRRAGSLQWQQQRMILSAWCEAGRRRAG